MGTWYRSLGLPIEPVQLIMLVGLVLGRSVPTLFLTPFLGGKAVPGNVKVGISLALTVLLLPLLLQIEGTVPGGAAYGFLMAKEVAVGITLGFLASLVFHAFSSAGRLADVQRGSNMGETFVYQMGAQTSYLGQFYFQAAIVIFLILNGHHVFLRGYMRSFEVLPVWSFPELSAGVGPAIDQMARLSADLFVIAVQLSAPVVIAVFLTDVGFGIINRASPQINVFMLSFPLKMFLGILMLLFALRLLADQFGVRAGEMIVAFYRMILFLGR